ncbi:MAG: PHP domain-containing protein [Vicinamibacterales bacterium]
MIDLHLHTTASDGRLTPAQLVARVAAAGVTTMSVTDHDTVASIAEVTALATPLGIRVVPGIEITAVDSGRDVHMLAYFIDPTNPVLAAFLERQRSLRVSRVRDIGARLAGLGLPVNLDDLFASALERPGSSIGRPQIARALVAAGHVGSVQEAFEKLLGTGQPAFVPRTGPSPADVVHLVHEVGGIASMAHPAVTRRDDLIGPLAEQGLDAIEVYHSDHTPEDEREYLNLAIRHHLAVSGGSDFHGDDGGGKPSGLPGDKRARRSTLGVVALPAEAFATLEARARARQVR